MQEADQQASGSQEARAQQQEKKLRLNFVTMLYFLAAKKQLCKSDYKSICLYIGLNQIINLQKLQVTFDSWNKYPI